MSKHKKNRKPSSFEDFKKYLSGELSEIQQYALEKRTVEEDFEGEALEGFEKFDIRDVEGDINNLQQKISTSGKPTQFNYLKIAAVIALFISVTVVFFFLIMPETPSELSQESKSPSTKDEVAAEDKTAESNNTQNPDSILLSQEYVAVRKSPAASEVSHKKPSSAKEQEDAEAKADGFITEKSTLVEDNEEFLSETVIQRSSAKEKDLSIQKIEPIQETELEPIPEIGNFNRIASSKVKPTENTISNKRDENLPSQLKYPEGIQDVPKKSEKENLSVTMAGRTFSQTSRSKAAGLSSEARSESKSYEGMVNNVPSASAKPEGGFEAYYEYLYKEIQSLDLSEMPLPTAVDIKMTLENKGTIKQIAFSTDIDNDLKKEIEKILLNGPKWVTSSTSEEIIDLKLEFQD